MNGAINSILSLNCSKLGEGCINATIRRYKSSKVIIDCGSIRIGMRGYENISCEIISDGPGSNNLPMTTQETLSIYSWYDIDLSIYIGYRCKIKCNGKNSCQNSYIKCNGDYNKIHINLNNNNCPNNYSIQCPNNNNCHKLSNGINSCEYSSILCPNNTNY